VNIHPIRTRDDYRAAMERASYFFDNMPEPGTEAGDEFDILITLIESYERKNIHVFPPNPIDAIKFRMDQAGLTPKDLVKSIGQQNRVYEILNGRRELTLPMIRNLNRDFGIPIESLVGVA
jgi:HTH-type transcriptional regulator/antitoxin HigA